MVQTVVSLGLPVGEHLSIKKNRIEPLLEKRKKPKRISIVTGCHGDELEGQYVCYELTRRILQNIEGLNCVMDVYPAINPLAIDCAQRMIPKMEMDMNRIFPGSLDGTMMERAAAGILEDLAGSDICIDVHASGTFEKELPQVRISEEFVEQLLPYAKWMNVDMIWVNATATVHESTLAHSLNMVGVPTLVVEMGLGNRINKQYGNQVVTGIMNLMKELELWEGAVEKTQMPVISTDGQVEFLRAEVTGMFLPSIVHNHFVQKNEKIGEIVDPISGTIIQEIVAPKSGLVFTLREYPMIYEGALIARILTDIKYASA